MMYKTMKVFDVQKMPDNIKKLIFDKFSYRGISNDVYIGWYPYDFVEYKSHTEHNGGEIIDRSECNGDVEILERGDDPISDWLIDNGADRGTDCIIKYWW